MRLRTNLKQLWRGVTEEEYANLAAAASERKSWDTELDGIYPTPQEAEESIVGAVLWASFVLIQDRPVILALGGAGIVASIGFRVLEWFH